MLYIIGCLPDSLVSKVIYCRVLLRFCYHKNQVTDYVIYVYMLVIS